MKIAVFFPNYIGDVLMTTPALRFLKLNYPRAAITAVVNGRCAELLDENPYIDALIIKSSKFRLLKDLAALKPDAAVLFRTTFFNAAAAVSAGACYTAGSKEEFAGLLLKSVVPTDSKRPYRADCLAIARQFLEDSAGVAAPVEVDLSKMDFAGWNTPEVLAGLRLKLKSAGVDTAGKFISLCPAATRKTKMQEAGWYSQLLARLKSKYPGHEIILAGSSGDSGLCSVIAVAAGAKSLAGRLSLKELGALIAGSRFFISPDTGPAYIAQAVGAKALTYFTSTDPGKYGPFPGDTVIFYRPLPCSPCYKDECRAKAPYRCLQNISPSEIADKTDEYAL